MGGIMRVYGMTPEKFDGSSSVTDGLIVWVKAPSLSAVVRYGERTGFEGRIDVISDWAFGRDSRIDFEVNARGERVG
jgi:hypothetical protein